MHFELISAITAIGDWSVANFFDLRLGPEDEDILVVVKAKIDAASSTIFLPALFKVLADKAAVVEAHRHVGRLCSKLQV